jgi:hypothetical protein
MDPSSYSQMTPMSIINNSDNLFTAQRIQAVTSAHFPTPYFANLYTDSTPSFGSVTKTDKESLTALALQQQQQQRLQQQGAGTAMYGAVSEGSKEGVVMYTLQQQQQLQQQQTVGGSSMSSKDDSVDSSTSNSNRLAFINK